MLLTTPKVGKGEIGGKAAGFLRARDILVSEETRQGSPALQPHPKFPVSLCIATDVFDVFVAENHLQPFIERSCQSNEEVDYLTLRAAFVSGQLPNTVISRLQEFLKILTVPLAIRSSSRLEDQPGTSFAGKYETTFTANRGLAKTRLAQMMTAIKGVYASTYNPNAITYRRKRSLADADEKMAVLVQEAVGREYKSMFLPLIAGVGFSQNGYRWTPEIKKEDGLVRLVFGLGTRAVGRGYAHIFSPGKPLIRPEGKSAIEIERFSQAMVDALDLTKNELVSFHFSQIVKNGIDCYPHAERLFSLRDETTLYQPVSNQWDPTHKPVLSFETVLGGSWLGLSLPTYIHQVFAVLEKGFGCAVDVEFAIRIDDDEDKAHFYLVQARPLSQRESMMPRIIPWETPKEDQLFSALHSSPSGRVSNVEYLVFVDPKHYHLWPLDKRYDVARMVGKINRLLQGKVFILMGPGRWGSVNVALGVPTKYSEISNCAMLVEVAKQQAGYTPEVSYGTHFFQDLLEDGIVYLPLYPDEPGVVFNENFLQGKNALQDLMRGEYDSSYEALIRVIHIPAVTGGRLATAALNGEEDKALIYLK